MMGTFLKSFDSRFFDAPRPRSRQPTRPLAIKTFNIRLQPSGFELWDGYSVSHEVKNARNKRSNLVRSAPIERNYFKKYLPSESPSANLTDLGKARLSICQKVSVSR
jgi:hypothetical protein